MAERERGATRALVATGALAALVIVGSAYGGGLVFTGARWSPQAAPATARPVSTPTAAATPPSVPPTVKAQPATPHDLTLIAIIVIVAVFVLLAVLAIRALRNRRWRLRTRAVAGELQEVPLEGDPADAPDFETSEPVLRRGLRRALEVIASDRRPSDAIVTAWLGLEEAAADAGHERSGAETPTEYTTRILLSLKVDASALDTLRRLYLGVRFGDHEASTADVDAARAALQRLEDEWTASTSTASIGISKKPPANKSSANKPTADSEPTP